MKLISWNVNGIRACLGKGLPEFVSREAPDVLCLQEVKARSEQVSLPPNFDGYHAYWNSANKPGYSGVAIFTREEPKSVEYGLGDAIHDQEGRVITMELADLVLVNVYTPNAQNELRRLPYRLEWDEAFRLHLVRLADAGKPVVFCGDLNVAHQEIDLARPKQNHFSAGFSDQERESFTQLLDSGFKDTYRELYPDTAEVYSWWSYRAGARRMNVGWRIDYFGITNGHVDRLSDAKILGEVEGSDHCPVTLELNFD